MRVGGSRAILTPIEDTPVSMERTREAVGLQVQLPICDSRRNPSTLHGTTEVCFCSSEATATMLTLTALKALQYPWAPGHHLACLRSAAAAQGGCTGRTDAITAGATWTLYSGGGKGLTC